MILHMRHVLLFILSTVIVICAAESAVAGGLIGYRNDTKQPVIVQSTVLVNNQVRRSKPQLLYPGETAVDGLNAKGIRRITLFDPLKPNAALHQEDLNITDDVMLSIQLDSTVTVKDKPVTSKYKLVATVLPGLPGRPGMPGPKPPGVPPKKK